MRALVAVPLALLAARVAADEGRTGPLLPVTGLFASSAGQPAVVPRYPRLDFDLTAGPFFPIDGDEDFDVGGTFDFKFSGEVARNLFLGVEFAFAAHGKDAGDLLSEGDVERFYFMIPFEVDIPIAGFEENPLSLRLGVAPGFQVTDPAVDEDLEDDLFFQGFDLEEEPIAAFNLRARAALRIPIGPHFGVIVEAAYDWSEGIAETRLRDLLTGDRDTARGHVSLSGVSALFGIQILY